MKKIKINFSKNPQKHIRIISKLLRAKTEVVKGNLLPIVTYS